VFFKKIRKSLGLVYLKQSLYTAKMVPKCFSPIHLWNLFKKLDWIQFFQIAF